METWKQISWLPAYEVSDLGNVRHAVTKRLRKLTKNAFGYLTLGYAFERTSRHVLVHRLVCEAFHGPQPQGKQYVCHNDGIRQNNIAELSLCDK